MKLFVAAALLVVSGCGADSDVAPEAPDTDFITLHWALEEPHPGARMCEVMGTGEKIPLDPEPVLPMSQFDTAWTHPGDKHITVRLTEPGAETLSRVTRSSIGRRIAIVVDDQVAAMPVIQAEIKSAELQLMPQVSADAAEELASRINAALGPRWQK